MVSGTKAIPTAVEKFSMQTPTSMMANGIMAKSMAKVCSPQKMATLTQASGRTTSLLSIECFVMKSSSKVTVRSSQLYHLAMSTLGTGVMAYPMGLESCIAKMAHPMKVTSSMEIKKDSAKINSRMVTSSKGTGSKTRLKVVERCPMQTAIIMMANGTKAIARALERCVMQTAICMMASGIMAISMAKVYSPQKMATLTQASGRTTSLLSIRCYATKSSSKVTAKSS